MTKKYKCIDKKPLMAAEPAVACEASPSVFAPFHEDSLEARVKANTVSVDAYFDELISLVRKDYANL